MNSHCHTIENDYYDNSIESRNFQMSYQRNQKKTLEKYLDFSKQISDVFVTMTEGAKNHRRDYIFKRVR